MVVYRAYTNFTAHGRNIQALMSMYALLESASTAKIPLTTLAVFLAFSVESYLNAIGGRKIEFWDQIERLSWRSKVEILYSEAKQKPDWGSDPLQFAIEVFKIRDRLAHGKPERIVGPDMTDEIEAHKYLRENAMEPDWYTKIDRTWAMAAKERFRQLMIHLATMHGFHESDHLNLAIGGIERED